MTGRAAMTRFVRTLRACWAEFDPPTTAVLCLGTLVLAFTILSIVVVLVLALPCSDDLLGYGSPPDLDGAVVARSTPHATSD